MTGTWEDAPGNLRVFTPAPSRELQQIRDHFSAEHAAVLSQCPDMAQFFIVAFNRDGTYSHAYYAASAPPVHPLVFPYAAANAASQAVLFGDDEDDTVETEGTT